MRFIPRQNLFDAIQLQEPEDFLALLNFVREGNQKADGRLKIDGPNLEAVLNTDDGSIKVVRYQWLIRLGAGTYKAINNTEFEKTYQRAA